jgi:hypothetical protein
MKTRQPGSKSFSCPGDISEWLDAFWAIFVNTSSKVKKTGSSHCGTGSIALHPAKERKE